MKLLSLAFLSLTLCAASTSITDAERNELADVKEAIVEVTTQLQKRGDGKYNSVTVDEESCEEEEDDDDESCEEEEEEDVKDDAKEESCEEEEEDVKDDATKEESCEEEEQVKSGNEDCEEDTVAPGDEDCEEDTVAPNDEDCDEEDSAAGTGVDPANTKDTKAADTVIAPEQEKGYIPSYGDAGAKSLQQQSSSIRRSVQVFSLVSAILVAFALI